MALISSVPSVVCALRGLELVVSGGVAREDRALDRTIGRPQRREAVLLLHVFRNLQPAQRLDLPLRRSVPHRVGAPNYLVLPETLDQRADHGRGQARMRDAGVRKAGAELGVHVLHAKLLRDLGEIRHPVDAAGVLELLERSIGQFDEGAQRRVIDDEGDLRPVFGRLAQVPHRGVFPDLGPALLVIRRQQPLVDADRGQSRLHALLVEGIDALFIVEPPVRALLGEKDRIADGVALPAVGLESLDAAIDFIEPAVAHGLDDGMRQHAARARDAVDRGARRDDLVIGEKQVERIVDR